MNFKKLLQSPGFLIYAFLVGQVRSLAFGIVNALGITSGPGTPMQRAFSGQGGAVVTVNSNIIANLVATPAVLNSANIKKGNIREDNALVAIANGDNIASRYLVTRLRSSDRVSSIKFWAPDIGTTVAADLGLWDTAANGAAVVDQDFFASAVSFASGPYNGIDVTFEAGAAGGDITKGEQRIWEALGLSADPQKEYDVCWTLTAASDAAGSLLTRIQYVSGE